MSSIDFHSSVVAILSMNQFIVSPGTFLGAACDTKDSESAEMIVLGLIADGTFELFLEESENTVNWNTVDNDSILYSGDRSSVANKLPTIDNTTTEIPRFGYVGAKSFIRLVLIVTGTTNSAVLSTCLTHSELHSPTPEQPPKT